MPSKQMKGKKEWCFKYQCKCSDKEDKTECPNPCGHKLTRSGDGGKMMKEVKVKVRKDLVCPNCGEIIYKCNGCKNYFIARETIKCSDNTTENYHYCQTCRGE